MTGIAKSKVEGIAKQLKYINEETEHKTNLKQEVGFRGLNQ